MKTVYETVPLGNSENSFFEPDLILCGYDTIFEINSCNISHEELTKFINSVLGVGEEGPAEFLLASSDNG